MKQTTNTNQKLKPRWITAQSDTNVNHKLKKQNIRTHMEYHAILKAVKEFFMPLHSDLAFERDYTQHPDERGIIMHCFMTKTFYWQLSCGACDEFNVYYDFCNCPFEENVKTLLAALPSNYYIQQTTYQPDLQTVFKRHLRLEDGSFFTKAW